MPTRRKKTVLKLPTLKKPTDIETLVIDKSVRINMGRPSEEPRPEEIV